MPCPRPLPYHDRHSDAASDRLSFHLYRAGSRPAWTELAPLALARLLAGLPSHPTFDHAYLEEACRA